MAGRRWHRYVGPVDLLAKPIPGARARASWRCGRTLQCMRLSSSFPRRLARILRRPQSKRPVRLQDLLVSAKFDQISIDLLVVGFAPVLLEIPDKRGGGKSAGHRWPIMGPQPLTQLRHAASLPVDRLRLDPVCCLFRRRPHVDEGCVRAVRSQSAEIRRQGVSGTDLTELLQGRLDARAAAACVPVDLLIELSFQLVVFHLRIVLLRVFQFPAIRSAIEGLPCSLRSTLKWRKSVAAFLIVPSVRLPAALFRKSLMSSSSAAGTPRVRPGCLA